MAANGTTQAFKIWPGLFVSELVAVFKSENLVDLRLESVVNFIGIRILKMTVEACAKNLNFWHKVGVCSVDDAG